MILATVVALGWDSKDALYGPATLPVPPDPHSLPVPRFGWSSCCGRCCLGLEKPRPASHATAQDVTPGHLSGVERIVAIGDIHGDHERFFGDAQAVPNHRRQTELDRRQDAPGSDRRPGSRPRFEKVIDLLMQLEEQAKTGGKVHALIGNHA